MSAHYAPDVQADLAELLELHTHLPEPHRQRADQLLERLTLAELARTEHKAKRLQKLVSSRLIPAEQRTKELCQVVAFVLDNPRLSAAKARARLAKFTRMPKSRVREYQELLVRIKPKLADAKARATRAEQTLRERIAESRSLRGRWRQYEGAAPRREAEYDGEPMWKADNYSQTDTY
jgi:hypothetical protein